MKEKNRNWGGILGFAVFMGALLWIGGDLFRTQMARRGISELVSEGQRLREAGMYVAGLEKIGEARGRWLALEGKPGAVLLGRVQPLEWDFAEILAEAHRDVGRVFTNRQIPAEAEWHYALAMAHDPEIEGVAGALVTECFYTKNLELGWIAAQMARKGTGTRPPARLLGHFEENYRGPRY